MSFGIALAVLFILLGWIKWRGNRHLAADPRQRQLAAMLVDAAFERNGANVAAVRNEIAILSKAGGAGGRARLIHATKIARHLTTQDDYANVVEFSSHVRRRYYSRRYTW